MSNPHFDTNNIFRSNKINIIRDKFIVVLILPKCKSLIDIKLFNNKQIVNFFSFLKNKIIEQAIKK